MAVYGLRRGFAHTKSSYWETCSPLCTNYVTSYWKVRGTSTSTTTRSTLSTSTALFAFMHCFIN